MTEIVAVDDNNEEIPGTKHRGVLQPVSQSPDRIDALKQLVSAKGSKFREYDKKVKDIDLLIYDSGDLVSGLETQKTQVLNYLRQQEKANTLMSPFRNVLLLIDEPGKDLLKIHLKSS